MSDDDKIDKRLISTERGLGHDLSETPVSPPEPAGLGADWFGPRAPMRPVAPPEVAGRVRDYLVGLNLTTLPRPEEPIGFHELRFFADASDIVRLLIERRKDQLVRLKWAVRAKKGHRADAALLDYVTSFFERPHFEYEFSDLVRILAEKAAEPTPVGATPGRHIFGAPFEGGGFRVACRMGLEGLVSKRRDRPYQAGRSKHWLKVKNRSHPAMDTRRRNHTTCCRSQGSKGQGRGSVFRSGDGFGSTKFGSAAAEVWLRSASLVPGDATSFSGEAVFAGMIVLLDL